MNAALLFESDAYLLTGPRLMGRQAAGNGFLRAAVHARGDRAMSCFARTEAVARIFQKTVLEIDAGVNVRWIPSARPDLLAEAGVLYRPDSNLLPQARQRLRAWPAAYSLCGVTHTLSTGRTLNTLGRMLTEPLMPWDAMVCTSSAALAVVSGLLEREAEHLRWQTGHAFDPKRLLLPVIPLGVHTADFAAGEDRRRAAREALGLAEDDVAILQAGRLSVSSKGHPHAMFHALQTAAEQTGKPLVLILAGQAPDAYMKSLFEGGLAAFCPDVRAVFVDGKDTAAYGATWAAADLFISLSDSIQETFGITPLEAMAAGLPALVSDWNGYKDTVRDGVDGFRIRTWAPPPGGGGTIAAAYEAEALSYDEYLSRSNTAVALDMDHLVDRLKALVGDPALRRRMGEAGRLRARETFEWSVVFKSYQALWDEQTAIRTAAARDPATAAWLARAPRAGTDHLGPFDLFAGYPTAPVSLRTRVALAQGATPAAYRELAAQPVIALHKVTEGVFDLVHGALAAGPLDVESLAAAIGLTREQTLEVAARLAKLDVVKLRD